MTKILVVDDDLRIAQSLGIRLKSVGLEVVMANDGFEAVQKAIGEQPDLIVLDISLPAGDGFTIVERMRTNSKTMMIPVIFITASRRASFRERAESLGAAGFFEKPYVSADLMECIHNTLEAAA
ncbi:MAG: CheY-like chemotaxis protein [Planctomycetota bacterium]|jgi:CheY-like chemotaxis protein